MVGELPDAAAVPGSGLREGDAVLLLGPFAPSLAGSELVKLRGELAAGLPGNEIEPIAAMLALVRTLVREGRAGGAHDVSDGGLACAVAEMAIAGGSGAELDLDPLVEARGCSGETALFGEGPGGILLSVPPDAAEEIPAIAERDGVSALNLGRAGGDRIEIAAAEREVSVALTDAERAWRSLGERIG
jgi:phosphoribosylformylglycinamidine synthase